MPVSKEIDMTRTVPVLPFLLALTLAASALPARAAGTDAERAEIKAVETTFATSIVSQDREKFAAMLDDDVAFIGPLGVKRGKAAIVQSWSPFFGPNAPLYERHAAIVELTHDGSIAFIRGLWLTRSKGKDGKPSEQRGTFNSVWRKGAAGWKLIFDAGCPCEDPAR